MNAWKVILATLVIFGAGVVTGGLLVSYAIHANQPPFIRVNNNTQQPMLNPWQVRIRELLRRMENELDLTPVQRENIEKIIADSQERTKELWKPIQEPMHKEMQRLLGQIRKELTQEQKQKFNKLVTRPNAQQNRRRFLTNSPSSGLTNSVPDAAPAKP